MRNTILATLLAMLSFSGIARAETYPSHPITIIVPFSAGGPSDAMARIRATRWLAMTLMVWENMQCVK